MLKSLLLAAVMLSTAAWTTPSDVLRGEYQLGNFGGIQTGVGQNGPGCIYEFVVNAGYLPQNWPMFYYAGAGKGGSAFHIFGRFIGNLESSTYGMLAISLPTAPVSGISNWSGNAKATFTIVEQLSNPTTSPVLSNSVVQFTINFVPMDNFWFQGLYSITLPGGCIIQNNSNDGQPIPVVGTRTGTF